MLSNPGSWWSGKATRKDLKGTNVSRRQVLRSKWDESTMDQRSSEELRALRKQHTAQDSAHARGTLRACALKISGIQWSGVRNSAIVLGVFAERTKESRHRIDQARTEGWSYADVLVRFSRMARPVVPQGFV